MSISAKIIADSVNQYGNRLTTMELRYPRFIHAEVMTHRVFSRNASSSRAIPVSRLIEDIERDLAKPVFWGKNQPGMQAAEELDELAKYNAQQMWEAAMWNAIRSAKALHAIGAHKQIVNRLLEPFSHINVLVTSTSWANWYALRVHKDAQPEIRALAEAMLEAHQASTPTLMKHGESHLPYVDSISDMASFALETALKVSVARCARVSYLTHEGKEPSLQSDLDLYDRLVGSEPLHASPAEHQAMPDRFVKVGGLDQWAMPHLHGNFTGWIQYRKTVPNEFVPDEICYGDLHSKGEPA